MRWREAVGYELTLAVDVVGKRALPAEPKLSEEELDRVIPNAVQTKAVDHVDRDSGTLTARDRTFPFVLLPLVQQLTWLYLQAPGVPF
jgi:hypothetical protein